MKNVSRNNSSNKFLLCFRPVDMDQLILESKPAVIGHGSRHSRPFNCFNPENRSSSVQENVKKSENSTMVGRPSNRTLSKVIKAVLFETILAKRVRDRKSLTQDSYQSSKRGFSRHAHKSLDSRDYYNEKFKCFPLLSSQSSVGSSSSSSSTCSNSSIPESKRQNKNCKNHHQRVVSTKPSKKEDDNNNNHNNMGGTGTGTGNSWSFSCVITLLLIIILTITCIWGRLPAIFCTTTCFYYLPRRSKCLRWQQPENEAKRSRKSESGEYQKKRRIIIEGLLERNYHRKSALNAT